MKKTKITLEKLQEQINYLKHRDECHSDGAQNRSNDIKQLKEDVKQLMDSVIKLTTIVSQLKEIDEVQITVMNQHKQNLMEIASGNFGDETEVK